MSGAPEWITRPVHGTRPSGQLYELFKIVPYDFVEQWLEPNHSATPDIKNPQ
jgi:hypothetical protein